MFHMGKVSQWVKLLLRDAQMFNPMGYVTNAFHMGKVSHWLKLLQRAAQKFNPMGCFTNGFHIWKSIPPRSTFAA